MKYLFGVDIGGTAIKIGQFDAGGSLLQKWDIPTDRSDAGSHILRDVRDAIAARVAWDEVRGVGFGVPGPVVDDVVLTSVNLGWGQTDVPSAFRALLDRDDILVRASNDANVACQGEFFRGAGKGFRNVVLFTLGTGVGGGIVVDGSIVDGKNGAAGELGHLVIDFDHRLPCNCGKRGCLETVASATGIVNLARHHLRNTAEDSLLRRYDDFSAKRVFDCAKTGDAVALRTVDEAADYLGRAIAGVLLTLNPDVVVLGGGVSNAGPFFIDRVAAKAREYSDPFAKDTPFVGALLGNDAGMVGAASLVR